MKHKKFSLIVAITVISFIIRFFITNYVKIITIYPDELRYYSIANSIVKSGKLFIYGQQTDYQKILYSIVISPAFLVDNYELRMKLIWFINNLLISTGVVPVVLISKKYLDRYWDIVLMVLVYLTAADLMSYESYMSESLFIPMALLAVYFLLGNLELIEKPAILNKKTYFHLALEGVYFYFCYLCKEISLVFIIVSMTIMLFYVLLEKQNFITKLLTFLKLVFSHVIPFVVIFLLMKHILFTGMGNSYNQQSIGPLNNPFNVYYVVYSTIYFLIVFLFVINPVVIIVPLINKSASRRIKHAAFLLVEMLIVTSLVVGYTISLREDWGTTVPRFHMRYISYLPLPFFVLFIASVNDGLDKNKAGKPLIVLVLLDILLCSYIFVYDEHILITSNQAIIDHPSAILFTVLNEKWYQIICFMMIGFIYISMSCLLRKHIGLIRTLIIIFALIINVANSSISHYEWTRSQKVDYDVVEMGDRIHNFIKSNDDKEFLFISEHYVTPRAAFYRSLFDTFVVDMNVKSINVSSYSNFCYQHNISYNKWLDSDIIQSHALYSYLERMSYYGLKWKDWNDSFKLPKLRKKVENLTKVDYIFVNTERDVTPGFGCELVEQYSETLSLYRVTCPHEIIPNLAINLKVGHMATFSMGEEG